MNHKRTVVIAILAAMALPNLFATDIIYNYSTPLINHDNGQRTDPEEVVASADGYFLSLFKLGATATTNKATFFGRDLPEDVANAEFYVGNSYNSYRILTKHDAKGEVKWQVATTEGDIYEAYVAPTSDGGAVLVLNSRYENSKEYKSNKVVELIDEKGNRKSVEVEPEEPYKRIQHYNIAIINGNGEVTKTKIFASNIEINKTSIRSVITDNDDNIYIAGYHNVTFTFGETQVTPHNGEDNYSAFLVKLDKELNYKAHSTSESEATKDQIDELLFDNGTLYVVGQVTARVSFSFGGKTDANAEASPEKKNELWVAALDANDLSGKYLHIYPTPLFEGEKTNQYQPRSLVANDGYLYLSGGAQKGGFVIGEESIIQKDKQFHGFVAKIDANDGSLKDAYLLDTGISQLTTVLPVNKNQFYIFGYDWSRSSTGETINLYHFVDKNKITLDNTINLLNQGQMIASFGAAKIGNDYVFASTYRGGGAKLYGNDEEIIANSPFTGISFGYTISADDTAITSKTNNNIKVEAAKGALRIEGAEGETAQIFDLTGRLVANQKITSNAESINLSSGIYILKINNITKKVRLAAQRRKGQLTYKTKSH